MYNINFSLTFIFILYYCNWVTVNNVSLSFLTIIIVTLAFLQTTPFVVCVILNLITTKNLVLFKLLNFVSFFVNKSNNAVGGSNSILERIRFSKLESFRQNEIGKLWFSNLLMFIFLFSRILPKSYHIV